MMGVRMVHILVLTWMACSSPSTYFAGAFMVPTASTAPPTTDVMSNFIFQQNDPAFIVVPGNVFHRTASKHTKIVAPKLVALSMALREGEGKDEDKVPSSPIDRPIVSLIDTVALTTFAAVGKASHNPDGSWDVLGVLLTAFPFLVSWFAVAPLMGCFTPQATTSGDIKQSTISVAKGWILAVPLGCLLRGAIKGYLPPISFVIVTLIATLVLLSAGRAAYTAAAGLYMELF